jgi:anti-sigma factor RsiW
MNCEWRQKTLLYADDELDSAAQAQVAAHLQGCAECSAAVAEQLQWKKSVRLAGQRFSAPPELRKSIRQKMRVVENRSPSWRWAFSAAVLLLVTALGLLLLRPRQPQPDVIAAEIVDQHITTLASQNPLDVLSTDRHTVKPWFQGKLPFAFNLPELANSPFTLIGGKSVYVQQSPGAELLYEIRKHKISVFVFQSHENNKEPEGSDKRLSFTVQHWSQGGLQFYLATDATKEDAARLMTLFQEANRP